MNIAVISFTQNGFELSGRIRETLEQEGDTVVQYKKSRYLDSDRGVAVTEPLQQWAGKMFASQDAVVFVGASGIAVRAIAPHIKDKKEDPAVLIVDEHGNFCIPLLAGHIGGANELALRLCEHLGCTPVITTATDVNQQFAVDVFAVKNNLVISDMRLAKEVSAKLLHHEPVGFVSELPVEGNLPHGLCRGEDPAGLGICVGIHMDKQPFKNTLWLIPRIVTLGIGCRRETPKELIESFVEDVCQQNGIFHQAIGQAASIDLKKEEKGILEYCDKYQIPFKTYTAGELNALAGEFPPSEFVASVTGVDNVCTRSAAASAEKGRIIQNKIAKNGVTVALAIENRSVKFE